MIRHTCIPVTDSVTCTELLINWIMRLVDIRLHLRGRWTTCAVIDPSETV